MTTPEFKSWQAVQEEVRSRINARVWKPGELIPNEADLAAEFGCARATVNRALRTLAEAGVLDRRRKAGTRVALHPVRKAMLSIPIIRQEIEDRNARYGYALIAAKADLPPPDIRAKMRLPPGTKAQWIAALHLADGEPFVYETRWVNRAAVARIDKADLSQISANEWLVTNAPFTHGEIAFSALTATAEVAAHLNTTPGMAVFALDRLTWNGEMAVTAARLIYHPGYRMRSSM